MRLGALGICLLLVAPAPAPAVAQTPASAATGPYARISVLHPRDGHTIDFEAGYLRHLAWHQQAKDTWTWYGWTVTFGERQRWFVYATFGHSGASLDNPVAPADDERDNVLNVAPHVDAWENALYEYLPSLSRGSSVPQPAARLELTTVALTPGAQAKFEAALSSSQATLRDETLWFRMVAGGDAPRYVRLRPRANLAALLDRRQEQAMPDGAHSLIEKMTVEILTLRPGMSLGLAPAGRELTWRR